MFTIEFEGEPCSREGEALLLGVIRDLDIEEQFRASIGYWGKAAYEAQWQEGIRRVLGGQPSALITSMRDPASANFIEWWLMYPLGDVIAIQNQMLFMARLAGSFQENDPYRHIAGYRTHNSDGDRLSEWIVARSDLEWYLTKKASM